MKKPLAWFLVLLCIAEFPLFAQQPAPANPPAPSRQEETQDEDSEGVVKIGTTLVQIDAVVTDWDGKIVRDLTADDFEIYEGKRKQPLTNFAFIDARSELKPHRSTGVPPATPSAPRPKVKPSDVKRTTIILVDDLSLRPGDASAIRKSLTNFVLNQMGPNDLVGIVRTLSGSGALQQLTNDPRLLLAGIEKIYPHNFSDLDQGGGGFPAQILNSIIRGVRNLPGRKSIILVSDGFPLTGDILDAGSNPANSDGGLALSRFQQTINQAVRSSVVIYTMHSQGLATLNYDASRGPKYRFDSLGNQIAARPTDQSEELSRLRTANNGRQDGLIMLAKQSGGIAFRNSNDFSAGLQRILDDQSGYYLLGFTPDEAVFKPGRNGARKYQSLTVKVKRPGLTVRSRNGFAGITDAELKKSETPEARLVQSLISPFATSAVKVRLTSLFMNEADATGKTSGIIRSLLYFDANDLTFVDDGDGWKKAEVGLFAMLFGDNGELLEKVGRTQTLRLRGKTLEAALRNGFVFTLDLPAKKTGAYQIKAAVRDNATQKIGSGSQFIETPKIEKDRIALSGLVLNGLENRTVPNSSAQLALSEAPSASPAVREFAKDGGLSVSCFVYNPVVHPQTRQPAVTAQIKVFKDGKEVFAGNSFSVPPNPSGVLELSRAIGFSSDFEPGEYSALVIVTDLYQTDSKRKTASQWLDFTIVAPPTTNK